MRGETHMRRESELAGRTGFGEGWRGLPGERLAVWGADGGVAEYVRCDKVRDECEARYFERRTGRTSGSCAVRGCAGEKGELQPLSLMSPVQRVAVMVGLVASVVIGFGLVLRRQEKAESFASLERAYRAYAEDPNWEGTASILFQSVHRSGFKELKECIARDPGVALAFYDAVPDARTDGFAIAAAEAVGIDARGRAKEVGFEVLRDCLMREFSDYVKQPPNSGEPAVQVPALGSSDAMKWQGWTQSNGPQTMLSASESSYWGRAGTELLASATPEGSGRRLAAEPLSVIIVETDDGSRHFEFLQMTTLASSGMRFRAKTPDGWRAKVVAGAEWEQLLRMAGRAGTEER